MSILLRAASFRMAREYAPWIALAYAIIGREDQAEEIMGCVRGWECRHP